jgi:predicted nucleic acid-binding protein
MSSAGEKLGISNGCKVLYAEDLQHLQVIDEQLTIVNPCLPP